MATPFLKWAGGKSRLVPHIIAAAPQHIATYREPFVGAGAIFFALQASGRIERAVLNDSNRELMDTFRQVRDNLEGVVAALELLAAAYLGAGPASRGEIYYAVRASCPTTDAGRAARTIFLNKTCYNGLYRVNRKGEFNVPHGDYKRPPILDCRLLSQASAALQCTRLESEDFETACAAAQPGDFVYLDPPYHPLSATSSFTGYTHGAFSERDQVRLRDTLVSLTERGVAAALSNSDHPFIHDLYSGRGFDVQIVTMGRAINSVGAKRAPITELLIVNRV